MPIFIPSPFPTKNKLLSIASLCALLILSNISVPHAKSDSKVDAYYYFLLSQIVAKNFDEMELYLRKALEQDRKSLFLKKNLLNLYLHQRNYTQAEKLVRDLKPHIAENREIALLISRLYLSQNKTTNAIQVLERYLTKNPTDEMVLGILVSIYIQQRKWDEALEKLETLSRLLPQEITINIFKARIYREKGEHQKAKEHYLKTLEKVPDNRALLLETLRYLETIKDLETIEKILLEYLSRNPDNRELLGLLFGFYFDRGEWDKSEEVLRRYLERHKDQPEILFYLGLTLEQRGKLEEAIQIYRSIPEDAPWFLEAQRRVLRYLKKHNLNEAKELVNRVKERRLKDRAYYIFLLHAYEDLDLCEEGIVLGKDALKHYPVDLDVILAVALNYACLEDYEKVLELVEPLQERYPDDPYVLNFIGYSLVELERDLARAEDLLIKADALKPNDPYILDSLGWLYYKKGNMKQALEYLERAVSLLTEDEPVILWHFGDVLRALGNTDRACEYYRRALNSAIHRREKIRILEKLKLCP